MPNETKPALLELKLKDIHPSPDNPRKHFDADALAELANSLATVGLAQPLTVRPRAAGGYELVAGERRWRAAALAQLATVPCYVRAVDDRAAAGLRLVENLQREDLSWAEEADAMARLIELKVHTPDTLATALGKQRSYVYARLKLARLPAAPRAAFARLGIPVAIARFLAVIPAEKDQLAAAQHIAENGPFENGRRIMMSARAAEEYVKDEYCRDLRTAPFDPTAPTLLTSAGACGPCPYRSGNTEPGTASPHVCTNVPCYNRKVAAAATAARAAQEAKGFKCLSAGESKRVFGYDNQISQYGAYRDPKSKCPDDPQKRTHALVAELCGVKPVIAFTKDNQPVKVYVAADLRPEFEKRGWVKKETAPTPPKVETPEAKAARVAAEARAEALAFAARRAVRTRLTQPLKDDTKFWNWALVFLAENNWSFREAMTGMKVKAGQWNLARARQVLAEYALADTARDDVDAPRAACAALGVDWRALEKQVATPPAKPAKAKKKGRK